MTQHAKGHHEYLTGLVEGTGIPGMLLYLAHFVEMRPFDF